MTIDRNWIQTHIPHQGNMCLLHAVERWDSTEIVCSAISHLAAGHPLRNALGLPITAGIEYAAQAMAVHGALLAPVAQTPDIGYLTSVRNVQWTTERLDNAGAPLRIQAARISGNESSLLYDFSLHCEGRLLLSGRASVMTKPPGTPATLLTTP
jgi:predicted hotdog family 3-hydroxylacyl-ACP dehydratase